MWNGLIDGELTETSGFKKSKNDPCLYTKCYPKNRKIVLTLHVDDMLVTHNHPKEWYRIKTELAEKYKLSSSGDLKWFLNIAFERGQDGSMRLHQTTYIDTLVKKFGRTDAKPVHTPMEPTITYNN